MCLNMLFLFEKILYNSICERLRYFYFVKKRRIKKALTEKFLLCKTKSDENRRIKYRGVRVFA